MMYTLILAIPILLILVVIMTVTRMISTEHEPGGVIQSIVGLIPIVVVVGAAILIVVSMANTVDPGYEWDEDSGELTIQRNVPELDVQPWDTYASEIRTLIIEDNVSIGAGAFDTLTNLEYVSIGDGVTVASGAFGGHVKDQYGQAIAQPSSGEYYGVGDGEVYVLDPDIFTYNAAQTVIAGLADADAAYLVLPKERNGNTLTAVGGNAFKDQTGIVKLLSVPDSGMTSFYTSAFEGCTSLATVTLPDHITGLGERAFYGCSSLTSVEVPDTLNAMWASVFYNCTSLASLEIPDTFTTLGTGVFANCASMSEFHIPATVTAIGAGCFGSCTGVTEVSFEEGFNATLGSGCFGAWTFYDSDGTTQIEKTAANLAGFTFQGTASALVKVLPGAKSLTADQTLKVAKLTEIAAKEAKLEETDMQTSEIEA